MSKKLKWIIAIIVVIIVVVGVWYYQKSGNSISTLPVVNQDINIEKQTTPDLNSVIPTNIGGENADPTLLKVGEEGIWHPGISLSNIGNVSAPVFHSNLTYVINWGDGTPKVVERGVKTPVFGHTYTKAGTYNINFSLYNPFVCAYTIEDCSSDPNLSKGFVQANLTVVVK